MQATASICFPPKLIYVDYKGTQSYRYTPGALSTKQFDVYLELRSKGVPREQARQFAAESPKR